MKAQRGFALMLAIFLIVTLAALGVYMVTVSTVQVQTASQDEQSTRAYQAARAGIDWGAYQILGNAAGAFATACGGGASSQTITLQQGLTGFYSEVGCALVGSESEGAITVVVHRLTVTGCNSSPCGTVSPVYAERQLELTLTK